ncbi:MAG: adenosylcobinamide-phosphate synthase CbiB [Aquabacterium sp.]|nr:adenosylcobinamide-phosphate synthase CbiB [Aquabacterium sp.]
MSAALTLLLAAVLDRAFGEPRNAWHLVAWFGRAVQPFGPVLLRLRPGAALVAGGVAWALAVGGVAGLAWVFQLELDRLGSPWLAAAAKALLLKPAMSFRMLHDEVAAVEAALQQSLDAGRARVTLLCSRDVSTLDAHAVRETAIETLAENLNDAWVAPLFWFVVAGLPGAWAFRAANTLDAMWGYRGRWEWAGKVAARADDMLAWLPARITAALLWRPGLPLRHLIHEAQQTPSPNGGWPMATMALRLGISLGKPGVYRLNAGAPAPQAAAAVRALGVARHAAVWACAVAIAALVAMASSSELT